MLTQAQIARGMEVIVRKKATEINGHVYRARPFHGTVDAPDGKATGVYVFTRDGSSRFAAWEELFDPADRSAAMSDERGGAEMAKERGHGAVTVDGDTYPSLNAAAKALFPNLGKRGTKAWLSYFGSHGKTVSFDSGTTALAAFTRAVKAGNRPVRAVPKPKSKRKKKATSAAR